MLNWPKKDSVFGQKAKFRKFDICGNPLLRILVPPQILVPLPVSAKFEALLMFS